MLESGNQFFWFCSVVFDLDLLVGRSDSRGYKDVHGAVPSSTAGGFSLLLK